MKIIDRLRKQYEEIAKGSQDDRLLRRRQYLSVRVFCLDCNLLTFAEIEEMEFEIDNQ